MTPKRDTKIGRMRQYLEESKDKKLGILNYEDDAKQAFSYIFLSDEIYVDPDLYSPLLYKMWGEYLINRGIINSYEIIIKNYRYLLEAEYTYNNEVISIRLGSDALVSYKNCKDSVYEHRRIGGFALWPSHRGGINFRRNRYKDNIFEALKDIEKYNNKSYTGIIPQSDFEWFTYLNEHGNILKVFCFEDYKNYVNNLLDFEKIRTDKILSFLQNQENR